MTARTIALISMILSIVALGCTATLASAKKIYYPQFTFGEKGSGPGQLSEPVGVAVSDATGLEEAAGNVYVVDKGNDRVERFSASGAYLGQFNGSGTYEVEGKVVEHGTSAPTGAFVEPEQVAVDNCTTAMGTRCSPVEDPSIGDVYVTDPGHKVIDKFSPTGEYQGQLTETERCEDIEEPLPCAKGRMEVAPFLEIRNLTVDSSGALWVLETKTSTRVEHRLGGGEFHVTVYQGRSEKFNSLGKVVDSVAGTGAGNLFEGHVTSSAFAVDAKDDVYSAAGPTLQLERWTSAGEERGETHVWGVHAVAVVPAGSSPLAGEVIANAGGEIIGQDGNYVTDVPFGMERYAPFSSGEVPTLIEDAPGENAPPNYEGFPASDGLAVSGSEKATAYVSDIAADKVQVFVYVSSPEVTTLPATDVTETSMVLHGTVNPEGEPITKCYFEYGTEPDVYTSTVPCDPSKVGNGTSAVPVEAMLTELPAASLRSFRLVTENESQVIKPGAGLRISRPVITAETASQVGFESATVSARIEEAGLSEPSCYQVEYGSTASYGEDSARKCTRAGDEDTSISVDLSGLRPESEYHFRVAAHNALGEGQGAGGVFTTFSANEGGLPDGRVYEAVSREDGNVNQDVYVPEALMDATSLDRNDVKHGIASSFPFQASPNGEVIAYVGDPPSKGGSGSAGATIGNEYIARRSPSAGWTDTAISAPTFENSYLALSPDLSEGVIEAGYLEPLEGGPAYDDLYAHATAGGPFEPLLPVTLPRPRTEFGSLVHGNFAEQVNFGGANAGADGVAPFSHILFEADAALPSTPAAPEGGKMENDLYDWTNGGLHLVNVLPNGNTQPGASFGRQGPAVNGFTTPLRSNVISADGERIYWSAVKTEEVKVGTEEQPEALYVRENDTQAQSEVEDDECTEPSKACTVQVDRAEVGAKGPSGGGEFLTANDDGSKVFFTDARRLTTDSTAAPGAPDLYEYNLNAPEGERLTDLSVPIDATTTADVQGLVGISEDGAWVYFVADGVLTAGENKEGREPVEGQPNLYVSHEGDTGFVATLSSEDGDVVGLHENEDTGDWSGDPGRRTAEVSADGQSVVFMSRMPLTGYDSVLDGTPLEEVFVYDANADRLLCASCSPSGEPPVAPAPELAREISLAWWGSFVPVGGRVSSTYQPRVISADGDRVFFDSLQPLVPRADNGYLDVYEWERDGSGSCEEEQGCVYLLSGGQGGENSYLIDSSESGGDVFFVSRERLVKSDRGEADVLYDARVGGLEAEETACSEAGCQGVPPAPPIFATPASVTFEGAGNFPPPVSKSEKSSKSKRHCASGLRLRGGKCVRRGHKAKRKEAKRHRVVRAGDRHRVAHGRVDQ